MDIAIIGATGSCGRQVAAQLVEREVLHETSTLHLIGHEGGSHANELWGLRADLRDAFADSTPRIEVGTHVEETRADVVIMMAGATVTRESSDRAALAATNRKIFTETAESLGRMDSDPIVIVQSNPVELAMHIIGQRVGRHRLIGAAAWSDSLRFRRELAEDLGVVRPMVHAEMWGQHGDHLVPIWSRVHARGVTEQHLADVIGAARDGRRLADLPEEIREARGRALALIQDGDVVASYAFIQAQPADVRAAIKPFFIHFTAGRTTELATAHAAVDVTEFIVRGQRRVIPAQVNLKGEQWGIDVPLAVAVTLDPLGWVRVEPEQIASDERDALDAAAAAVAAANAAT